MNAANSAVMAGREIMGRIDALSVSIAEAYYFSHPDEAADIRAKTKAVEDCRYHLRSLAGAMETRQPLLFAHYVEWAAVLLAGLRLPAHIMAETLRCMRDVLLQALPAELAPVTGEYLDAGLETWRPGAARQPGFAEEGAPHAPLARDYMAALLDGDRRRASSLILIAADSGTSVADIYLHVFQPSQRELGRLWQTNRISVAMEHYCTAATQLIMSQLYPRIFSAASKGRRLVAACVGGDLHEIGLRMISDFFEMQGWDTFYLGANTPTDSVIRATIERRAHLLAISVTMTYHLQAATDLIARVRATPECAGVRVMVGGYPFNIAPGLWQTVGADAWAGDAGQAVGGAERLEYRDN